MIVVQLLGRLGNCMFLFGLGLSLQKMHPDKQVRFYFSKGHPQDTKEVCEGLMDVFEKDFRLEFVQDPLPELDVIVGEFDGLHDIPFKDNMLLRDFFQSHKFLDEELCQRRLGCPRHIEEEIVGLYGDLSDHVGVHVRRGDYIGSGYFVTMGRDWYLKCMGMFPEGQKFVVVSDDMEWCRENLGGDGVIYADKASRHPNLTDMYVQSLCRDNVISASSFSWWGAYLNRNPLKRVLAPHRWHPGPDLPRYYTKHMMRIEP
jgi:hypothetical protein